MKTSIALACLILPLAAFVAPAPASAGSPFCTNVRTKIGDGSVFNQSQGCDNNLSRTMQVGNGTVNNLKQVGRNNDAGSYQIGNGSKANIYQRQY